MRSIVFDTDIGIDDAMALLLAHYSNEIDLLAITTVYGNASVEDTTRNALYVKQLFEIEAPVYQGASEPLSERLGDSYPVHVHGKNGLGDIKIPDLTTQKESVSAAQALVNLSKSSREKFTIVSVGGLTNIALALAIDPDLGNKIEEIVVMGGAFGYNQHRGNVSPVAEANIANDPTAADRIFRSNISTTIVGLDVTHEIVVKKEFIEDIENTMGAAGKFIAATMKYYLDFHHSISGRYECPLHDASAIAYLLNRELFKTIKEPVRAVTEGIALGQTIHGNNLRSYVSTAWDNVPDSTICTEVDSAGVLELYRSTLKEGVR